MTGGGGGWQLSWGLTSGACLQGEDPDCGGIAAAHYGACHRQRSEAVAHVSASVLVSLQTTDILNMCRRPTTFAVNAEF